MIEGEQEKNAGVPRNETPDELEAGPELDVLVDERIFGIRRVVSGGFAPCYSTDIAAAWLIVEKLGQEFALGWLPNDHSGINWDASFGQGRDSEGGSCIYAETAPLAICRSALKASAIVQRHVGVG